MTIDYAHSPLRFLLFCSFIVSSPACSGARDAKLGAEKPHKSYTKAGKIDLDEKGNVLASTLLTEAQQEQLGAILAAKFTGSTPKSDDGIPPRISSGDLVVHIMLRSKGGEVAQAWADGESLVAAGLTAIEQAKALAGDKASTVDTFEVNLGYGFVQAPSDDAGGGSLTHRRRGIRGIEYLYEGKRSYVTPTRMLAYVTSYKDEFNRFARQHDLNKADYEDKVELRRWESQQLLVKLEDPIRVLPMMRGNTHVKPSAVTKSNVQATADLMGNWLFKHMRDDGRETYRWFPCEHKEAEDNNMIRQWMASVAMVRFAIDKDNAELLEKSEKNIAYNLENFYVEDKEGKGLIVYKSRATLGEQALAALAIYEHPNRARFSRQYEALLATTKEHWNEDGSFHVTLKPKRSKTGLGNNYYPGETLLLWSFIIRRENDPELLRMLMKSFVYYKQWHLNDDNRAPAFIPWHTQAYYNVWTQTKNKDLQKFVFRMNTWLIDNMQRWKHRDNSYPDADGRFYNSRRSKWGSANSSSTGVYIEGLIDAYAMAKEVGDKDLTEKFRLSLARAMRSLMQIQYVDEVDTFCAPDPEMAIGGIRTSVHRWDIRVDNTQHNLMGVIRLLHRFGTDDFATD